MTFGKLATLVSLVTLASATTLIGCADSGPTGAPRLSTLTVALSSASIPAGRTGSATALGVDQYGDSIPTGAVQWQSSAPNVASIDANGRISALAVGTATISASIGSVSGTKSVTVTAAPVFTALRIVLDDDRIAPDVRTFTGVYGIDQYGARIPHGPVTWASSNVAVARIQGFGEVIGVAPGTAVIKATAGGKSAEDTVTVTDYRMRVEVIGDVPESPVLGEEVTVALRVVHANGEPVLTPLVPMMARPDDGSEFRMLAQVDATGIATFRRVYRGAAGRRGFIFTVPSAKPATVVMNFQPGRPALIQLVAGNEQSARVQTAVPIAPKVRVTDIDDNPVPGAAVLFTARLGNGRVTGANAITDANGEAAVGSWTLGDVGSNVLTAVVTVTGVEIEFVATGLVAETAHRGAREKR